MTGLTAHANFVKYVLYIFNFCFAITGIIILSIGLAVQSAFRGYEVFLTGQFFSVPSLLVAIGIIIFFISVLGCYGAVKESYCITLTFAVFLLIVFILELAAGISGYVLRNETQQLITDSLHHQITLYNKNHTDVQQLWDDIQNRYDCCGVTNSTDWMTAYKELPLSCCKMQSGLFAKFECNADSKELRDTGCVTIFSDYLKTHAVSLGIVGITLAMIQLFGIMLICYLAKQIKNKTGHTGFN